MELGKGARIVGEKIYKQAPGFFSVEVEPFAISLSLIFVKVAKRAGCCIVIDAHLLRLIFLRIKIAFRQPCQMINCPSCEDMNNIASEPQGVLSL